MCRNIKKLFKCNPPANETEIRAASLQFVRKLTGFPKPSQKNDKVFNEFVVEIANTVERFLQSMQKEANSKTIK